MKQVQKANTRIHIIGMGEMGQVVLRLVQNAGFTYSGFDLDQQLCVNCPSGSHSQTMSRADVIIVTTPSFAIEEVIQEVKESISESAYVYVISKGAIGDTQQSVAEYVQSMLGDTVCVVYGPMIAEEIIAGGVHAATTICGTKPNKQNDIQIWNALGLVCDTSADMVGIGVLSMVKNTYAIVLGALRAQNISTNIIARVYTEMLNEAQAIVQSCGGDSRSILKYAGIGDMLATGLSKGSSNGAWGEYAATHKQLPTEFYAEGVRAGAALEKRIPSYTNAVWLRIGALLGKDAEQGLIALRNAL